MTIIQDCEGILYPDKFSKIYNTSPGCFKYIVNPRIRNNPRMLICERSTWREIKNKKILAAINALNKNHKNFMIAVESLVGRPVTIGLDKNGRECYKQLIESKVYTRPDKAPEPSIAFKWVEFLINQEVKKL